MNTNTPNTSSKNDKVFLPLIVFFSILLPLAVAILFYMPKANQTTSYIQFLPLLHACINFTVSMLLVFARIAVKNKKIAWHRKLMSSAFLLSTLFLISYVTYHFLKTETHFGGIGWIRMVYFFILLTHIVLAAVVLPFVLLSFYRAWNGQIQSHKKWAKITFPIWLYVSITGVLVYILMAPYYPS